MNLSIEKSISGMQLRHTHSEAGLKKRENKHQFGGLHLQGELQVLEAAGKIEAD